MIHDLHHRRSMRLKGYDYTQPGAYFVTVMTQDRIPVFGEICECEMHFSKIGEMVRQEWLRLERRFPNVGLDGFIIMPNHMHGIIILNESRRGTGVFTVGNFTDSIPRAPTIERYGAPTPGSISTIMRSFKTVSTKRINEYRGTPGEIVWQRNYYEHVIRDDRELDRVREYIQANPCRWMEDEEYHA